MANSRKPRPFASIPLSAAVDAPKAAFVDFQDSVEKAIAETTHGAAETPSSVPAKLETPVVRPDPLPETAAVSFSKNLSETKASVSNVLSKEEEKTATLASGYTAVANGVQTIQMLTLDALKENLEANLAFVTAFTQVKTLSEAVALQSAHARKQYDAVSAQWKSLAGAAQRLAYEGAQ